MQGTQWPVHLVSELQLDCEGALQNHLSWSGHQHKLSLLHSHSLCQGLAEGPAVRAAQTKSPVMSCLPLRRSSITKLCFAQCSFSCHNLLNMQQA